MRKIVFYLISFIITISLFTSLYISNLNLKYSKYNNLIADDTIDLLNKNNNNQVLDVLVSFKNNKELASSDINNLISDLKFNQQAQNNIINKIKDSKDLIKYESFYIVNTLRIKAKKRLITSLFDEDILTKVETNREMTLNLPEQNNQAQRGNNQNAQDPMWNIEMIKATKLWEQNIYGEGITVGIIDTAVDVEHPALKRKFKGYDEATNTFNYQEAYYDALEKKPTPNDARDKDHGTHVAGSILGSELDSNNHEFNKVGVAPKAKFINARTLDTKDKTLESINSVFLDAGQWMLAPNGKVENRPRVINNSWGGGSTDDWYKAMLQNWIRADIIPVFAAGNRRETDSPYVRPRVVYPGAYDEALTVGAVDKDENLASFSCAAHPSDPTKIKPELVAPGVSIKSTWPNNQYHYLNGTSMATPHVVGLIALLLSYKNDLGVEQVKEILKNSAKPREDQEFPGTPNSGYGYGLIDAEYAQLLADNKKIFRLNINHNLGSDAILEIYKDNTLIKKLTNFREIKLSAGEYRIKINKLGYKEYSELIDLNQNINLDLNLEPEDKFNFNGKVKSNNLAVSNAKITLETNYGKIIAITNHLGEFNFEVPKGKYRLTIFKDNFELFDEDLEFNKDLNKDYELSEYSKETNTIKNYTGVLNRENYPNGVLHIGNYNHNEHFGYEGAVAKFSLPTKQNIYALNAYFLGSNFKEFRDRRAKLSVFQYDNKHREIFHLKDEEIDIEPGKMNIINLAKYRLNLVGDVYFKLSSINTAKTGFVLGVDNSKVNSDTSFVSEGGILYHLNYVQTTTGDLSGNLMMELTYETGNVVDNLASPEISGPVSFKDKIVRGTTSVNGDLIVSLPNGLSYVEKVIDNKFEFNLPHDTEVGDEISMYLVANNKRSPLTYLRIQNNLSELDEVLSYTENILRDNTNLELAKLFNQIKADYNTYIINKVYPSYDEVINKGKEIKEIITKLKNLAISNDPIRADLAEAIKNAEALLNETIIADDSEEATTQQYYINKLQWNILNSNVEIAKNTINNLNNGATQINERLFDLNNRIEDFKYYRKRGTKIDTVDEKISEINNLLTQFKEALIQNNHLFNTTIFYEQEVIIKYAELLNTYLNKDLTKLTLDELTSLYKEIIDHLYTFKKEGVIIDDLDLINLNTPFKYYQDFLDVINEYHEDNINILKIKEIIKDYYLKLLLKPEYSLISELANALKKI